MLLWWLKFILRTKIKYEETNVWKTQNHKSKKTDNNSMSEKLSHNFVNVRAAKVNVLLYTFLLASQVRKMFYGLYLISAFIGYILMKCKRAIN